MNSDSVSMMRLTDANRECNRHLRYLHSALTGLAPILPLSGEQYQTLDEAQVKELDQFIFRFMKLQDAMGLRLFPAVLDVMQEARDDMSVLDRLNRLEKLNLLESATDWVAIRELRNRLTHEYPDDPELNAQIVNLSVDAAQQLEQVLDRLVHALSQRGIDVLG